MVFRFVESVSLVGPRFIGGVQRIFATNIAFIAMIALLGGCTVASEAPVSFTLEQPPLIEAVPLKVGVEYTDDLVAYEYIRESPESFSALMEDMTFKPGPASVAMFTRMLAAQFQEVI